MSARSFTEHHSRSLAKTISYRILIFLASYFLVLNLTRDRAQSLVYTIYWNIFGFLLYFLHERFWNRVHWGKQ